MTLALATAPDTLSFVLAASTVLLVPKGREVEIRVHFPGRKHPLRSSIGLEQAK
jgi:hypothetical protein